jgi:hypothetical protein
MAEPEQAEEDIGKAKRKSVSADRMSRFPVGTGAPLLAAKRFCGD